MGQRGLHRIVIAGVLVALIIIILFWSGGTSDESGMEGSSGVPVNVGSGEAVADAPDEGTESGVVHAKDTLFGVGFSIANSPVFTKEDVSEAYKLSSEVGGFISVIADWSNTNAVVNAKQITDIAKIYRLKTIVGLNPFGFSGDGEVLLSMPSEVSGASFSEPSVRSAFVSEAREMANSGSDYILLGTDVNLVALTNSTEFLSFVKAYNEAYGEIRKSDHSTPIFASFRYEQMLENGQWELLDEFRDLDIIVFTSYPNDRYGDPNEIPTDYYSQVLDKIPQGLTSRKIAFVEIGWPSDAPSTKKKQADFVKRLPVLLNGLPLEFVVWPALHDLTLFSGDSEYLNSLGLRELDSEPKPSWDEAEKLEFP